LLGFRWNLSSESGLFNGLQTLSAEIFSRSSRQNQARNESAKFDACQVAIRGLHEGIVADVPIFSKENIGFQNWLARAGKGRRRAFVRFEGDAALVERVESRAMPNRDKGCVWQRLGDHAIEVGFALLVE
jgi:hypothetical protein